MSSDHASAIPEDFKDGPSDENTGIAFGDPDNSRQAPEIIVIGDVFRERFQVPTVHKTLESPITYPEALRGKAAIRLRTIESGAVLHRCVIEKLFQSQLFKKGLKQAPTVPVTPMPFENIPWNNFATYLHTLGAFPAREGVRGHSEKVWRIASTLGLVEDVDDTVSETIGKEISQSRQFLEKTIRFATGRITDLAAKRHPFILVVNDRNHGFRSCDSAIKELGDALDGCDETDHLVIWHVRRPHNIGNAFALRLATSSHTRNRTIVVVNQECLRDAGVNIRFDVSYEHTFQDLLAYSQKHPLLKGLLRYPQVLIRFDYGVLHLATDEHVAGPSLNEIPRLISADAHGNIAGPYFLSPQRHGIITGRTFLMVTALLCEIVHWYCKSPHARLFDVLRMEGCEERLKNAKPKSRLKIKSPMGNLRLPSISRNTVLDQAIDLGILLNATHFFRGFGSAKGGRIPINEKSDSVLAIFDELLQDFGGKLDRIGSDTAAADKLSPFRFTFQHDEMQLTKLSRLSLYSELLGDDPQVDSRREQFSRVELLGLPGLISRSTIDEKGTSDQGEKTATRFNFERRTFEKSVRRIVLEGAEAVVAPELSVTSQGRLQEPSILVPYVPFGDLLVTFDRTEIDGYLSIRNLLESYLASPHGGRRPVSIAVFGPPGSGKGFTVNQILKSVGKSASTDSLTFNLSQFTSQTQLSQAFHRIQDRALASETPVAFFDEFDCSLAGDKLAWLRFFLSPMQDGTFFDGNETFHVGPAIFVFGGGTEFTFQDFVKQNKDEREMKAPDFISRLRGHLNIHDISADQNSSVTPRLQVRRALLLRSLLWDRAPSIFDETGEGARIDPAVIDAFLHVKQFVHGVRSMEAIIDMARVSESGKLQKSSLPTLAQLAMHVNGQEFLNIVNRYQDRQVEESEVTNEPTDGADVEV